MSLRLPELDEPKRGKFFRLRLFWDSDFALVSIGEEQITSPSDTAQVVDGGYQNELQLTTTQVRWLHEKLGLLVKVLDGAAEKAKARRIRRETRNVDLIDRIYGTKLAEVRPKVILPPTEYLLDKLPRRK